MVMGPARVVRLLIPRLRPKADNRQLHNLRVRQPVAQVVRRHPADSSWQCNLRVRQAVAQVVPPRPADRQHRQPVLQGHKRQARRDLVMKQMMDVARWRRLEEQRQWRGRRDPQQLDLVMVMMRDFEMATSTQLIGATLDASTRS